MSDGKEKVFGSDATVRKESSPLFLIANSGPPFLVTYCEWDYFPLGTQAQDFHAALVKKGIQSSLVFIPKQSHISEMLVVTREDDLTANSVVEFIRGTQR